MLNTVHGMTGGLQVASVKDMYLDARHVLSQPPGGLCQQLVGTLEHNTITLSGLRCTS